MTKFMLLLPLLLFACGDTPEEVLKRKGRPDPIECARTAEHQQTCTDGGNLIWTCGFSGLGDAECVNTGRIPNESGQ